MARYRVVLVATRYFSAETEVDADDADDARDAAVALAGRLDWDDDNGLEDIEVVEVRELVAEVDG